MSKIKIKVTPIEDESVLTITSDHVTIAGILALLATDIPELRTQTDANTEFPYREDV